MIRIIRILRRLLVAQSLSAFALLFVATGGAHGASIDADRPTVLITGSNRGIGLAFVQHYVAEGWNVLATARTPSRADELNAIAEAYEHLLIEQLDVTDNERIAELADRGIIVALVAPGPTVTDMLQTNRPSLVPRANTSEDAAVGMAAVIAGLDASYDGRPLSYYGSTVAW